MYIDDKLQIAKATYPVYLLPKMANRHGLIAGATGTGKTVTLKTIAQSMSDAGIPTFLADVKGDVSGVAVAGEATEKLVVRLAGAENLLVDIVINRGETSDEDRVYGSNTSIRRSDNFAGTHAVADGFKNERHAKTCLEAEMPIFGISI